MKKQKGFRDYANELLDFIEQSPSCYHVAANLAEKFSRAGFEELKETDDWAIEPGGKYFVVRNDSSIIAFGVPELEVKGFHMAAAHSDSPTFKLKENPEEVTDRKYLKLNTEKYGGMILSTWLDRPLSVAGRVAVLKQKKIVTKLVNIDKDLLVIPNVAIHMNSEINKGMEYNPQIDMLPLYAALDEESQDVRGMLVSEVAEYLGVKPEKILGYDLYLYARDRGRIFGRDGEFIISPKLDDLASVYSCAEAFVSAAPKDYISLLAVFDNEEVGSRTRQGADSTFLKDTIERICDHLAVQYGETNPGILQKKLIADSFLISADNAHAVHPNHPEKADPTNRPYLNGGIVIKYHGGQKYTTDAVSAAKMKALCSKAGVPYQTYANRSDIAGGSTLGNLSAAHVAVSSVDIGLPQLAMHSAAETGGVRDIAYAVKVLQKFFSE